jgi:3-phytase
LQAQGQGLAYTDEFGVDLFGNAIANDELGGDLEGIAVGPDGTFWAVDEYRPAIYNFAQNGVMIDRFIPAGTAAAGGRPSGTFGTEALPALYAQRRCHRR